MKINYSDVIIKVFAVTNRGGKLLKPVNYFGYRIPVFFTKKEAIAAKKELDDADTVAEKSKRGTGFERQVVSCDISYKL